MLQRGAKEKKRLMRQTREEQSAFQVGIHFLAQTCKCVLREMCGGGEKCRVGEHVDLTHCHYSSTSSTYPHYEAEELRK